MPLDYAKVLGRLGTVIADGPDVGDEPDTVWCSGGTVVLEPLIKEVKVLEDDPVPSTRGVFPISMTVDENGYLTRNGQPHAYVLDLTSDKVTPRVEEGRATHSITFVGTVAGTGADTFPVTFQSATIRITKDGIDGDGLNDITRLTPLRPPAGVAVSVGPRGVSVEDVDPVAAAAGDLVFSLTSGDVTTPVPLPVGPGGDDAGVASHLAAVGSESGAAAKELIGAAIEAGDPVVVDPLNAQTAAGVAAPGAVRDAVDVRATTKTQAELPRRAAQLYGLTGDSIARPLRPGIVSSGDSIDDNNHSATSFTGASYSRTTAYRADGYLARAMVLARQPCSWHSVGVSGNTTAQMLARFDTDVTPLRPLIFIDEGGTNDARTGVAASVTIANRLAMWTKAFAFGAKVIAMTVPPAADSTTAQRNTVQVVNAWMREYARSNPTHFALVDWWPILGDPLTGGVKTTMMDTAGVHPNTLGALSVAQPLADAILRFLPPAPDPLPVDNVNDLDCLMSKPLMTGNIGGKGGVATGSVADGWFLNSGATSAVGSKVTRADGLGDWQQIEITGTGTTSMIKDLRAGSWAVGDVVQALFEFQTDATGWADGQLAVLVNAFASDNVTNLMQAGGLSPGQDINAGAYVPVQGRMASGILATPPFQIPTNTTKVEMRGVKLGAGTIRWGRYSVRKLPV